MARPEPDVLLSLIILAFGNLEAFPQDKLAHQEKHSVPKHLGSISVYDANPVLQPTKYPELSHVERFNEIQTNLQSNLQTNTAFFPQKVNQHSQIRWKKIISPPYCSFYY